VRAPIRPTRRRGRPSRFDERREAILRGAARVFRRLGFDRASIRDVAAECGTSLAGLYYYTKGKQDLLFQIQKDCFERVLSSLEERLRAVCDPQSRVRGLIENHLGFFLANMDAMKVLAHEADSLTGRYRGPIDELKRRYVRIARDLVADLAPRGRAAPRDPAVAALALFGMMNWIYTWYDPRRDGDARALASQIADLFLHGVRGRSSPPPLSS
jgi:AcrR family transcriptional regulator